MPTAKSTEPAAPGPDAFGYNAQWGYYLDRATGMYLCQHRWYDPSQGRWLNRDPIGYEGGVNLYGYCEGSPVGLFDSSGYEQVLIIVGPDHGGLSSVDVTTAIARGNAYTNTIGYSVRIITPVECSELSSELGEPDLLIVEVIAHAGYAGRPEARVAGRPKSRNVLVDSASKSVLLTPGRINEARRGKAKLKLLSLCTCGQGAPLSRLRQWQKTSEYVIAYQGPISTPVWNRQHPTMKLRIHQ